MKCDNILKESILKAYKRLILCCDTDYKVNFADATRKRDSKGRGKRAVGERCALCAFPTIDLTDLRSLLLQSLLLKPLLLM